jgi:hypothetical protein
MATTADDLNAAPATTHAEATTTATAAALWELVSVPVNLVEFSEELQAIRPLGSVSLGETFEGDNGGRSMTWTTISTVTEAEPFERFSWTVGDLEAPVSIWTFTIADLGTTRVLTQSCALYGNRSGLTAAIERDPERADAIIEYRLGALKANMERTVAGLCALAENLDR